MRNSLKICQTKKYLHIILEIFIIGFKNTHRCFPSGFFTFFKYTTTRGYGEQKKEKKELKTNNPAMCAPIGWKLFHTRGGLMGFINVFGRVATVVHGQTKLFELNCFKRKKFSPKWIWSNQEGKTVPVNLSNAQHLIQSLPDGLESGLSGLGSNTPGKGKCIGYALGQNTSHGPGVIMGIRELKCWGRRWIRPHVVSVRTSKQKLLHATVRTWDELWKYGPTQISPF